MRLERRNEIFVIKDEERDEIITATEAYKIDKTLFTDEELRVMKTYETDAELLNTGDTYCIEEECEESECEHGMLYPTTENDVERVKAFLNAEDKLEYIINL